MKSVEFDPDAFEDLVWWIERDRGTVLRIVKLVRDIQRDPSTGIWKPERLKHELAGSWSRRIDQEHRIVYQVKDESHPHPLLPKSLLIAPQAAIART